MSTFLIAITSITIAALSTYRAKDGKTGATRMKRVFAVSAALGALYLCASASTHELEGEWLPGTLPIGFNAVLAVIAWRWIERRIDDRKVVTR